MVRLRSAVRWCVFALLLIGAAPVFGYSLLTHEQLIDLTWDDSIVPLLLSRFPNLTQKQLEEARAYAYGGCVIQDIGYYPFGEASFSDLTHYVRSGDFVVNLFRNAKDQNDLAFAIGALSHYVGDSIGHPIAVNVSVPVEFPKLRAEYGPVVNYAQGERQHVRTEFAFDVNEVVHKRMAPLKFLRHIGLQVSMRQLSLAFYQTYGFSDDFTGTRKRRVNVKAYRFAVRAFIPRVASALAILHRRHEPLDVDTPEAIELRNEIKAMAAADNWQKYRDGFSLRNWLLAVLIAIVPKVGPLKLTAIKGPTPQTEDDYVHSLSLSVAALRRMLVRFTPPQSRKQRIDRTVPPPPHGVSHELSTSHRATLVSEVRRDPVHPLPNRDLDTGDVTKPGGYPLTDQTYAALLHALTSQPKVPIPPGIKEDIQTYYANPDAPINTKRDPQRWATVQADLETLKDMPTSATPEPYPTYEEDNQP